MNIVYLTRGNKALFTHNEIQPDIYIEISVLYSVWYCDNGDRLNIGLNRFATHYGPIFLSKITAKFRYMWTFFLNFFVLVLKNSRYHGCSTSKQMIKRLRSIHTYRLLARFIKTTRFFIEWVTTHSVSFSACHHWHNAKHKRAILIKRDKRR